MTAPKLGFNNASVCEDINSCMNEDGKVWNLSGYIESMTASSTAEFVWVTGTKNLVMAFNYQSTQRIRMSFLESLTFSPATTASYGTTLTVFNMNRSKAATETFGAQFFATPTGMTGTTIATSYNAVEYGKGTGAMDKSHTQEWTFKASSIYGVRIENRDATAGTFSYSVYMYEREA